MPSSHYVFFSLQCLKQCLFIAAQSNITVGDVVIIGQLCYDFYNCGQTRQRRKVAEIFTHFKYEIGFFPGVDNDFRLLKLDKPVVNIAPVKLDDGTKSSTYSQYKRLHVAGLGLMNKGFDLKAERLQELKVTYLPTDECRIEKRPFKLGDSTMCTQLVLGDENADRVSVLKDVSEQILEFKKLNFSFYSVLETQAGRSMIKTMEFLLD